MIFTWELLTLIIGFILGDLIYRIWKYRGGGVMAIPFLALYSIKFPFLAGLLIVAIFFTYLLIEIIFNRFVIYGRRMLSISLVIGIVITLLCVWVVGVDFDWYPLLLCGILGYNIHRETHSGTEIIRVSLINIGFFIFMILVGVLSIWLI